VPSTSLLENRGFVHHADAMLIPRRPRDKMPNGP
jgi:hypothetical protein